MSQTDCSTRGSWLALLDWTNRQFEYLSMVCLVTFSVFVFVQMAARNIFTLGLPALEELSRSLDVSMVFLIIPILMREGCHIAVDLSMGRLPPSADKVLKLLTAAVCIGFSCLFLYSSYLYMSRHWNVPSPVLKLPNIVFFGPAFLGMALFMLNSVAVFVLILTNKNG